MLNSRNLGFHLHRIAWGVVTEELPRWQIRPADPWKDPEDPGDDPEGSKAARRAGCLDLLYVYTRMIMVLQRRIDWTVNEALATGASYGDIAEVCGVSRQAARQRWLRRRERKDVRTLRPVGGLGSVGWDGTWPIGRNEHIRVRLVGGPRDGDWTVVMPGRVSTIEVSRPPGSDASLMWIARYVPTEDDLSVYTFEGLESKRLSADRMPRRPRVYEIAKEFGVESRAVMARLQEMGEFVRSASSTVEPDVLRRLQEYFAQSKEVRH